MQVKKKGIQDLQRIQELLSDAEEFQISTGVELLIQRARAVLQTLQDRNYPEEQTNHIISYCLRRVEHAQQLVQEGKWPEGLQLAKAVLFYFTKVESLHLSKMGGQPRGEASA